MLVESMFQVAMMEREQQLRDAERRQLLREYRDFRKAGRAASPSSVMDALAVIRSGFSLRELARLLRPA